MKVFTTGQVAKIWKVAPRTVSKWFDSGRLKGYRIPGSQDRRIPREYLIKFLKEHGMPLGDLEDEAMAKVLIVAQDQVLIENMKRELPPERAFKVAVAASGFEAGIQAESFHPDCIIVDFSIGRVEALQIYRERGREIDLVILDIGLPDMTGWEVLETLRNSKAGVDAKVMILSGYEDVHNDAKAKGADAAIVKPFRNDEVLLVIRNAIKQRNLEIERVGLASMSVGIARRCLEVMIDYANQRVAFGVPLDRLAETGVGGVRNGEGPGSVKVLGQASAAGREQDRQIFGQHLD